MDTDLVFHSHQLACLREVARSETFTEAARRLHVSQPALSQALAELERRIGLTLFERRGRRRVLTEAGREAARFASEVLGRAAEFQNWVETFQEGSSGTLTVGMIDTASLYTLPDAVRRFREAHPAVDLRLVVDTSTPLLERLRGYELDLAFVIGPVAADLDAVEVGREPLHVYAPAGSPSRPGDGDWALYPAGSRTRRQIDEGLGRLGITPRVTLESHNPAVLGQVVALGLGWSVLPPGVIEEAAGLERREQVGERVLLGVRRPGHEDPRVAAFLEIATNTAGLSPDAATPPEEGRRRSVHAVQFM